MIQKPTNFEELLRFALSAPDRRESVLSDPAAAAAEAGLDLSEAEVRVLKSIPRDAMDSMIKAFEESGVVPMTLEEVPGEAVCTGIVPDEPGEAVETLGERPDEPSPMSVPERLVIAIVGMAIREKASRILIEPSGETMKVRFEIDGKLADRHPLPAKLRPALAGHIKEMGGIEAGEGRAGEGFFELMGGGRKIKVEAAVKEGDDGVIELRLKEG